MNGSRSNWESGTKFNLALLLEKSLKWRSSYRNTYTWIICQITAWLLNKLLRLHSALRALVARASLCEEGRTKGSHTKAPSPLIHIQRRALSLPAPSSSRSCSTPPSVAAEGQSSSFTHMFTDGGAIRTSSALTFSFPPSYRPPAGQRRKRLLAYI